MQDRELHKALLEALTQLVKYIQKQQKEGCDHNG